MHIYTQTLGILLFTLMFINDNVHSLEESNKKEKRHNSLRVEECLLCEKLNLNSKIITAYLKNMITTAERKFKKCKLFLNEGNHTRKAIHSLENLGSADKNSKINSVNNLIKLNRKNSTLVSSSAVRRNMISLINKIQGSFRRFEKICSREKNQIKVCQRPHVNCTEGKWESGLNGTPWSDVINTIVVYNKTKKFNIVNEEPEYINITLGDGIKKDELFIWHANFANNSNPRFECRKVLGQHLTVYVTPNVNYLICLMTIDKYFQVNIFDCEPYKTKPLRENQPWLVRKSIPTFIISVFVLFVLATAMGASVLYLSVHKNPSLIRGAKRVIEVKRQDKEQILIMPKGYESLPQADSPSSLFVTNDALEPSSLSCDTNSTISYVSAIQPTPFEILTYRLSRLRELFQGNNNNNNNIPPSISSRPMPFSVSLNQRLPPNVDLLLEYEWYTIITTTTMTTTTEK